MTRLSQRQKEVALLITEECMGDKELAARLRVSLSTVSRHKEHLYTRLGVHSALEVARMVHRHPEMFE